MPYGILNFAMTDNDLQFVSKVFATFCASMCTKLVTTTVYHPQAKSQVEKVSKTLVARLRYFWVTIKPTGIAMCNQ